MARFYATMQGNRGEASRLGTPNSGIHAHARGWNLGGEVYMDADGDRDTVALRLTSGSNGRKNMGVEIRASEVEGPRTRFSVRLPGGIEVRGYVGDDALEIVKYADGEERKATRLTFEGE